MEKKKLSRKQIIGICVVSCVLLVVCMGAIFGGGSEPVERQIVNEVEREFEFEKEPYIKEIKEVKTKLINPILEVKSEISKDMRRKVWFSKEWKQEKINEGVWKVSVSDESAVWKVSEKENLCSESGVYVSICSDNGYAKTYSKLDFCKPAYICERGCITQTEEEMISVLVELQDRILFEDEDYAEKMQISWDIVAEYYNITRSELFKIVEKDIGCEV